MADLGRPCEGEDLSYLAEPGVTPDALPRELRLRGFIVRQVILDAEALRSISLPTLAHARDGGWLLLRARRAGDVLVEAHGHSGFVPALALLEHLSGVALELTSRLRLPGDLWRALLPLAARRSRALLSIGAATLVVQLFTLLPAFWTRLALDRALPHGASSLLNSLTLALVFAGIFQAWTTWLRQRAVLILRTEMQIAIERGFLDHLLRLPFATLHRRSIGDFMQAMSGLTEARTLLSDKAAGVLLDGVLSVTYLAVMASTLPAQTMAICLAGGLMAALSLVGGYLQMQAERAEVDTGNRQRTFVIEALSGVSTFKAMGAERAVLQRWSGLAFAQMRASVRRQRLALGTDIALEGVRQLVTILVIVWGGYAALRGDITLGAFVAFAQLSSGFLSTTLALTMSLVTIGLLRPHLSKAREIAALEPERPSRGPRVTAAAAAVAVTDLWFRYDDDGPWVLSGYDLRVEPGARHWIKGPSGSGKSTILRLIAGLYQPHRGSVRISGLDPVGSRGLVLYLPQFVHLYSGSILDNLKILSAHAPRHRLMQAAEESGLAAFVRTLPMGYETVLPPGGITLSGGQRQLIALTAAVACERAVLLLDEASANLDGLSQTFLHDGRWFDGKTVIYASHDAGIGPGHTAHA